MNKGYKNSAIQELRDQQVRYAPREKKIEQADRAESLLHELKDAELYSYQEICSRIIEFKTEFYPELMMSGESLRDDLRLLVEDLTRSAAVPHESIPQKVWSIEDLAEHFQVSPKTISRWREKGLISRVYVFEGKKRIAFLDSSVSEFVRRNPQRIKKGTEFNRLGEDEKNEIILNARRLAASGANPTEVAKRFARHFNRSPETIRNILKSFDQANPDIAIFPSRTSPLREETRTKVFQEFRSGEPVQNLAERYNRTPGSVYRILGQMRARRIAELPLDYIDNPDFSKYRASGKDSEILASMPPKEKPDTKSMKGVAKKGPSSIDFHEMNSDDAEPKGIPAYLLDLYGVPLLSAEQEMHLFRKMNYLKFLAASHRDALDHANPKRSLMDKIDSLYTLAIETKNDIVTANLRLVVSIAKKHVNVHSQLYELISDGNLALIRAVEKFDYARGNKFSTYASWAIMRNFARTIPNEKKYHERFHASGEVLIFESQPDERTDSLIEEQNQHEREVQIDRLMDMLDDREQSILTQRYGLGVKKETQSLRKVGDEMGITKERVRQIETRALAKLRKAAEDENLEIPGMD